MRPTLPLKTGDIVTDLRAWVDSSPETVPTHVRLPDALSLAIDEKRKAADFGFPSRSDVIRDALFAYLQDELFDLKYRMER